MYFVFLSLGLFIFSATILHLELIGQGTYTYGTDEADYYRTMLIADSMNKGWFDYLKTDYNFTYVLLGTLVFKTSILKSALLLRIMNCFLAINSLLLVYNFVRKNASYNSKDLIFSLYFLAFNGILVWTFIRNLKDTLFLYCLLVFLISLYNIANKRNIFLNLITISSSTYVLSDIRQWFPYFFVVLILIIFLRYLIYKKHILLVFGLSIVGIMLSIPFLSRGIEILRLYTISRMGNVSLFKLPIYMANFLVGPGPIRSLFPEQAFLHSTNTGNILIFLGSLSWWLFLPLFILAITSVKNIKENLIVFMILVFYWGMYSYANMGTGDTRMRAIMYVLAVILTIPYLYNCNKETLIKKYAILIICILFLGVITSYGSLS